MVERRPATATRLWSFFPTARRFTNPAPRREDAELDILPHATTAVFIIEMITRFPSGKCRGEPLIIITRRCYCCRDATYLFSEAPNPLRSSICLRRQKLIVRQFFSRGARGQEKEKKKFRGLLASLATRTKCHVHFRRSTAVRTTSDTPTEARTTGQLRDRQLAVVVTCLCVGGPCALPLVRSCLCKTCGMLDGLAAAAHRNVRSCDVSLSQEM